MNIPVKPEPVVTHGKIVSIELVEGEYGEQVEVQVERIPPSEFMWRQWFTPSSRSNSKWMRFVQSFNKARGSDIESVEEMIGAYVKIVELERSGEIRGEFREWTEPIVEKVYESEEEIYAELGEDANPFDEEEEPDNPGETSITDPAVLNLLKQLYEQQGEEVFMQTVKGMGYDPSVALKAIGKS